MDDIDRNDLIIRYDQDNGIVREEKVDEKTKVEIAIDEQINKMDSYQKEIILKWITELNNSYKPKRK